MNFRGREARRRRQGDRHRAMHKQASQIDAVTLKQSNQNLHLTDYTARFAVISVLTVDQSLLATSTSPICTPNLVQSRHILPEIYAFFPKMSSRCRSQRPRARVRRSICQKRELRGLSKRAGTIQRVVLVPFRNLEQVDYLSKSPRIRRSKERWYKS